VAADVQQKLYGAVLPTLTYTITGFVNGESLGTSGVTGTPTLGTAATSTSVVGGYQITIASGSLAATNYTFNLVPNTLTVNKTPLTVVADDKSRAYGAANAFTATLSGFVNGETLATSGVTGSAGFNTSATGTSSPGPYSVTPVVGTLTAPNYTFGTFTAGTLTIGKAPITVVADSKTTTYGAIPTPTFSVTGLANGETVATILMLSPMAR
jgi:hypothetical protein